MRMGLGFGIKLLPVMLLGSLSACGAFNITSDCACGYYTSNANKMIHWKDGSSLTFVVHKDVPQAHRMALLAVQQTYAKTLQNTSITIDTTSEKVDDIKNNDPYSVSGDGVNGIYIINGDWPFKDEQDPTKTSSADAMTVIRADGSGMKETDIFFRGSSFDLTPAQAATKTISVSESTTWILKTAPENSQWFYKVGVHEMGHALGLVHTNEDSIMEPKVSLEPLDKPFTSRDIEVLAKEYEVKATITTATK